MVVIPNRSASFGELRRTGPPSQTICPSSGPHSPAMVLTMLDLPAPLSPTRAVTFPVGISRSTLVRAWTAPKDFDTPRNASSGVVAPTGPDALSAPAASALLIVSLPSGPAGPPPAPVAGGGLDWLARLWT